MLGDSSSAQRRRVKIAGAVVAAVALAVVGVVALNGMGSNDAVVIPLEKAQALAHAKSANVPFSSVPDESSVETPAGWVIESDEPVDGPGSEEQIEEASDDLTEESPEVDDDIDSRMDFEEDQDGQKYKNPSRPRRNFVEYIESQAKFRPNSFKSLQFRSHFNDGAYSSSFETRGTTVRLQSTNHRQGPFGSPRRAKQDELCPLAFRLLAALPSSYLHGNFQ